VQLTNEAIAEAKLALTMPCKEEEDEVKQGQNQVYLYSAERRQKYVNVAIVYYLLFGICFLEFLPNKLSILDV
jgi:hypothetical protein